MKTIRITHRRGFVYAAGLLIAASAAGGVAGASGETPGAPLDGNYSVSLLSQPAEPSDALPASLLATPMREQLTDPSAARLAFTADSKSLYVAPGVNSTLCIIVVNSGDGTSWGSCSLERNLAGGAITVTNQRAAGGSREVTAIVSDGYAQATAPDTTARVNDNVFSLTTGVGTTHIRVSDNSTSDRAFLIDISE